MRKRLQRLVHPSARTSARSAAQNRSRRAPGYLIAIGLSVFGASAPAWAESMQIRPGLWQMHTEVSNPFAEEPLVQEEAECVTQEEAERSFSEMIAQMQGVGGAQECEVTELEESDGRATAKMHCEFAEIGLSSDATFDVRYTDTEFELNGEMTVAVGGEPMVTRFSNKGTWTSADCP